MLSQIVRGKTISNETIDLVKTFYCDNQFSRMMPGKKDYVSIGRNSHMQKRLLLCNLKELYAQFMLQYPNHTIGFSTFCSLRPKWCILVGPSGSHSVCVCTIHQNTTLLVNALKLDTNVHDLIDLIVCDRNSKECMMHRCQDCPGSEPLRSFFIR